MMNNAVSEAASTTDFAQEQRNSAENLTRWAADRTRWAADRTVIAWVRSAISMIGFGLGIGKAGDYLDTYNAATDPYHSMQIVGVALITLGVVSVVGAVFQNVRIERRLAESGFGRVEPTPLGLIMALLVLAIGIFAAIAVFL